MPKEELDAYNISLDEVTGIVHVVCRYRYVSLKDFLQPKQPGSSRSRKRYVEFASGRMKGFDQPRKTSRAQPASSSGVSDATTKESTSASLPTSTPKTLPLQAWPSHESVTDVPSSSKTINVSQHCEALDLAAQGGLCKVSRQFPPLVPRPNPQNNGACRTPENEFPRLLVDTDLQKMRQNNARGSLQMSLPIPDPIETCTPDISQGIGDSDAQYAQQQDYLDEGRISSAKDGDAGEDPPSKEMDWASFDSAEESPITANTPVTSYLSSVKLPDLDAVFGDDEDEIYSCLEPSAFAQPAKSTALQDSDPSDVPPTDCTEISIPTLVDLITMIDAKYNRLKNEVSSNRRWPTCMDQLHIQRLAIENVRNMSIAIPEDIVDILMRYNEQFGRFWSLGCPKTRQAWNPASVEDVRKVRAAAVAVARWQSFLAKVDQGEPHLEPREPLAQADSALQWILEAFEVDQPPHADDFVRQEYMSETQSSRTQALTRDEEEEDQPSQMNYAQQLLWGGFLIESRFSFPKAIANRKNNLAASNLCSVILADDVVEARDNERKPIYKLPEHPTFADFQAEADDIMERIKNKPRPCRYLSNDFDEDKDVVA